MDKNNEEVQKKLRDQNSDVLKAVSDAQAIGYSDGLVDRVDSLEQKVDGLESDINLREQNLDQKTQEYVAKAADLDQVGKYLEHYTQTVNNRLVPTLRNLILSIRNGITIDEVVKSTVNQRFKQDREDAQQASLSAKLSAQTSQQSIDKITGILSSFMQLLVLFGLEMVCLLVVIPLTPGWWKVFVAISLIILCGTADYYLYRKRIVNNVI